MVDFTPDPKLYPFQSRWFDGAGPRVHYVDEGQGTPVLMLHGNPTWSFLYRKVIGELRDRFRCVAVDYPGFGLSERPAGYGYTAAEHAQVIGRLVDHLQLDAFVVMGQDWGGPIGMKIALDHAPRVAGLVFANTWYWPAQGALVVFSLVMGSPLFQWQIRSRNFFVNSIMPRSVARPMPAEVLHAYQAAQPTPAARQGVAEFPKQIRRARPLLAELAAEAPRVLGDRPLELVWAMKDPAFGHENVISRWLRDFPEAHLTRVAEASHYIEEDAPEELAAAVRRLGRG